MYALVIDDTPAQQDKYLEILSWFGAIRMVLLATEYADIEQSGSHFSAVVVGQLRGAEQEAVVRAARRRYPDAKIVAAVTDDFSGEIVGRMLRAGADSTVDARISIWKTGLMLRQVFWDDDSAERYVPIHTRVPGLWVETA
jgi:DNA-binding NarL/FixJ family response regulator